MRAMFQKYIRQTVMELAGCLFTALKEVTSDDGLHTWKGKEKDGFQRGLEVAGTKGKALVCSYDTASTAPAIVWICALSKCAPLDSPPHLALKLDLCRELD